ncbi:MAG: L,D-transpeptidase [Kiritimatiellales bacterium]|nr:L,D-transpeptidase [Kiritimatiellales bacterium]
MLQRTDRNKIHTETYAENASIEVMTESGVVIQKEIAIDLGQQMMFLLEDGFMVRAYPVSSGKAITPTPVGIFQVFRKQELRISGQAIPYRMPYYLSFTKNGSHGMHALPYLGISPASSGYWSEALGHIGIPVSHGCVRLLPDDAIALYEWAEVGVSVTISYETVYYELFRAELETFNATGALISMP